MSNLRNVLKIYTLERQLNPDDIALLNTLRGMNESERELLVESLAGKVVKKTTKKSSKSSASKSPRASSLQQQIQSARATTSKPVFCTYELNGKACHGTEEDRVHDESMGYAAYHPFVSSNTVPPAAGRSSSKNGSQSAVARDTPKIVPPSSPENREPEGSASSSVASSKTETESVSSATGG